MAKDLKCNLKTIIDNRKGTKDEISLRQLAEESKLKFEVVRRLYHDTTKQYSRSTMAALCETLDIKDISELLSLVDKEDEQQ